MKLSRREWLSMTGASALAGAAPPWRYAICSETFAGASFAEACLGAKRCGYDGIEIDPAQLAPDPAALSPAERSEIRNCMRAADLDYAGLHSFLRAPEGLHLTTRDASVRARSWDYFRRMVDLAADLGAQPVMALGSSKQRMAVDGVTPADAAKRLEEGLARLAPLAEQRGVRVLIEPLAPQLCNVVTTLEEAMAIIRAVGSPAVQTIFDTHNTAAEARPLAALLREYFPWIRHVHLNEMDGRRPGAGNFPFALVMRTLRELGYRGWLSVEVFDFKPDGETVARQAGGYLRSIAAQAI